jgi:hypothetical protein
LPCNDENKQMIARTHPLEIMIDSLAWRRQRKESERDCMRQFVSKCHARHFVSKCYPARCAGGRHAKNKLPCNDENKQMIARTHPLEIMIDSMA